MISRRRKKERRRVPYWTDLPASDFILYRENRNPYRQGTPQAEAYDTHYDQVAATLSTAHHFEQHRRTNATGTPRGQK